MYCISENENYKTDICIYLAQIIKIQINKDPNITQQIFLMRCLAEEVNSCGRASKKVIYKNVPDAMHCKTPFTASLARLSSMPKMKAPIAMPVGDARENTKLDSTNFETVKPEDCARLSPNENAITSLCANTAIKI